MSSLRERVEGLVGDLAAMELTANRKTEAGRAVGAVVNDVRVMLAAALAAEGQGAEAINEAQVEAILCGDVYDINDDPDTPKLTKAINAVLAAAPSLHKEGLAPDRNKTNFERSFEKLFIHKGEDWDDPPDKWAWTIRGSFPIEVMTWCREWIESAALHKEGAGGECAYKKQHNIGFPCPHCGVIEPLPLQRTLPDEQFKGAVVEEMAQGEGIILNLDFATAGAIGLFEFLRSKGFEVARPAGRAEPK